jgi:hypothetical protein
MALSPAAQLWQDRFDDLLYKALVNEPTDPLAFALNVEMDVLLRKEANRCGLSDYPELRVSCEKGPPGSK